MEPSSPASQTSSAPSSPPPRRSSSVCPFEPAPKRTASPNRNSMGKNSHRAPPGDLFNQQIKQLRASNSENLVLWNRLTKTLAPGQCLKFAELTRITLKSNVLEFETTQQTIPLISFDHFFNSVPNIFKDDLPTTEYFDLSLIIDSYELLNPEKTLSVLSSWKAALENIHAALLKLESQISMGQDFSFQVRRLFFGEKSSKKWFNPVYCHPKEKDNFFEFSMAVNHATFPEITKFAELVQKFYIDAKEFGFSVGAHFANTSGTIVWVVDSISGNSATFSHLRGGSANKQGISREDVKAWTVINGFQILSPDSPIFDDLQTPFPVIKRQDIIEVPPEKSFRLKYINEPEKISSDKKLTVTDKDEMIEKKSS